MMNQEQYETPYYGRQVPVTVVASVNSEMTPLQAFQPHPGQEQNYAYYPTYYTYPQAATVVAPNSNGSQLYDFTSSTQEFFNVGIVSQLPPRSSPEFKTGGTVELQRPGVVLVKPEKEDKDCMFFILKEPSCVSSMELIFDYDFLYF